MRSIRWNGATATLALLVLAACSGSNHGSSVVPVRAPETVTVAFSIVVPAASSANSLSRQPLYISASTKSAVVTVTPASGTALAPVDLTCTNTCTGSVAAPIGSDTFAVSLYDQAAGAGNLLSSGSTTATIVSGKANTVSVTFNPVVAQVTAALSGSLTTGTAGSETVAIVAKDPDGNTIVGPGAFMSTAGAPVTVSIANSDTTGHVKLSTSTYTTASAALPTIAYDGAALKGNYPTITVSDPVSPTVILPATVKPGVVWTAATAINEPRLFALAPSGNIWFEADDFSSSQPTFEVGFVTPSGVVTNFPLTASWLYTRSITADASGNLWVGIATYNEAGGAQPTNNLLLEVTAAGTQTQYAIPNPGGTTCSTSYQPEVATGGDGNIWVFEQCTVLSNRNIWALEYFTYSTSGQLLAQGQSTTSTQIAAANPPYPSGAQVYINQGQNVVAAPSGFWIEAIVGAKAPTEIFVPLTGSTAMLYTLPQESGQSASQFVTWPSELNDRIADGSGGFWATAELNTVTDSLGDQTLTSASLVHMASNGTGTAFPIGGYYTTTGGLAEGVDGRYWFVNTDGYTAELEAMSAQGVVTDSGLALNAYSEEMISTSDGSLYIGGFGTGIQKVQY